MKCLVFGGTGFLGEHLAKRLVAAGHEVLVYNRVSERFIALRQKYPSINYISGSFEKETCFYKLLDGVDMVFHLISSTGPANQDVLSDLNHNIIPTVKMLDACIQCKVKKVIYFSSGGTVYGIPKDIPIVEESVMQPITSYGIQKLTIERYLYLYQQRYGLNYISLRIANPYGVGQRVSGNQGVIAIFLSRIFMGKNIQLWGDEQIIRDFIYVQDVMDAVLQAAVYKGKETVFNIGSGKGVSLEDIIKKIQAHVNVPVMLERLPGRPCDVPVNILDINKAKEQLQWQPRISLDEGIQKMCDSWNQEEKAFCF